MTFIDWLCVLVIAFTVAFQVKMKVKRLDSSFLICLVLFLPLIHIASFIFNFKLCQLGFCFDSLGFYKRAIESDSWFTLFRVGTLGMSFIVYPLIKIGVTFWQLMILFSFFSLQGFFRIIEMLNRSFSLNSISIKVLIIVLLFLPSLHVWSAGITKEALLFPMIIFFFDDLLRRKTFSKSILIAILFSLLIRPYLTPILLIVLVLVNRKKIVLRYYYIIGLLSVLVTYLLLKFLRITSFNSVLDNFNKVASYASNRGDSSIDLRDSSYLERLFLVLFRPLFYDSKKLIHLFVSIENLLLLILLILCIVRYFKNLNLEKYYYPFFVFGSFLMCFYAMYMYNLGLASRMRIMFIPFIYMSFIPLKRTIKA